MRWNIVAKLERIRRRWQRRLDAAQSEKPAAWISTETGRHIPLNFEKKSIGGAGGKLKGQDFSKAKCGADQSAKISAWTAQRNAIKESPEGTIIEATIYKSNGRKIRLQKKEDRLVDKNGKAWQYLDLSDMHIISQGGEKKNTEKPKVSTASKTETQGKQATATPTKGSEKPKGGKPVRLKDTTKTFVYDEDSSKKSLQQLVDKAGVNKPGKTVKTVDAVKKLAAENGILLYRTVMDNEEDEISANEIIKETLDQQGIIYNHEGGMLIGQGIYFVATRNPSSKGSDETCRKKAVEYGYGKTKTARMMVATMDKSAKIAKMEDIDKEFHKLPASDRDRFADSTTYAAAKGYDAVWAKQKGEDKDFLMLINRTMLIASREVRDLEGRKREKL